MTAHYMYALPTATTDSIGRETAIVNMRAVGRMYKFCAAQGQDRGHVSPRSAPAC